MKITFDCPDKINGLLTMTIESADYQEQVEKTRSWLPSGNGSHGND